MMGYAALTIDEVRHRAKELEHERARAEMMRDALEAISRKRIMDHAGAINMRSIALGALALDSKW